jgi:alkylation response protein AidB-like acyl-CoA dehydrogenase
MSDTHEGTDWLAVAKQLSQEFSEDIVTRDRLRASPQAQLDRIKQSGLSNLLIAKEHGGAGAPWTLALQTIREISAGDGSVGALYGYHQLNVVHLRREMPERWRQRESEVAEGRLWLAGVVNPRDDAIRFTPQEDHFLVNGQKSFCTGAAFADRLTISGLRTDDGRPVLAFLPGNRPGIRYASNWDHLGLARSESGSFVLEGVQASAEEVLPCDLNDATDFSAVIRTPVNQSVFANFYLGAALGALREAKRYVGKDVRAWVHAPVDKASDDPLVISQFGELWITLQGAIALAEHAGAQVEALLAAGKDFTAGQRGETAVTVAAAKVLAARTGLDITAKVFDVMGARATHNRYGFDRFWRDVRTHSLHDPLSYKVREVGDYALNDRYPAIRAYT